MQHFTIKRRNIRSILFFQILDNVIHIKLPSCNTQHRGIDISAVIDLVPALFTYNVHQIGHYPSASLTIPVLTFYSANNTFHIEIPCSNGLLSLKCVTILYNNDLLRKVLYEQAHTRRTFHASKPSASY